MLLLKGNHDVLPVFLSVLELSLVLILWSLLARRSQLVQSLRGLSSLNSVGFDTRDHPCHQFSARYQIGD